MTVQRDGELAVEVSPKRFTKQFAATYGQSVPSPSDNIYLPSTDLYLPGPPDLYLPYSVDLTRSTWDHINVESVTKVAEPFHSFHSIQAYSISKKTGTEKLRCKLDGLDAEIVDDLVGLPGPFPCTLKSQTPCFRGERP